MFEPLGIQPKSKHNPNVPVRPVIIPIGPSIAYVELTRGYFALIDSGDARIVGQHNWHAKNSRTGTTVYARRVLRIKGRPAAQALHAFLVCPNTDHRNGNGLDNRRSCNLRPSTQSQNNCNRRLQRNNKSGFKGVTWHNGRQRWEAIIQANGKRKDLGGFPTPEAAHAAYTKATTEFHGEFARVA